MNTQAKINASVEQVVEAVLVSFGNELNAGMLAKAATAVAKVYGITVLNKDNETVDYIVRQQMTTNYLKSGTIDGQKSESAAGRVVTSEAAKTWLVKFFESKINGKVVSSSRGVSADVVADQARQLLGLERVVEVDDGADSDEDGQDDLS